jgi:uncharacterized Zn-binding protein involved in type VI secretion
VATVGDSCSCPIRGHDGCTIDEGNPTHTVDGVKWPTRGTGPIAAPCCYRPSTISIQAKTGQGGLP